jgi:hypothetical protein
MRLAVFLSPFVKRRYHVIELIDLDETAIEYLFVKAYFWCYF